MKMDTLKKANEVLASHTLLTQIKQAVDRVTDLTVQEKKDIVAPIDKVIKRIEDKLEKM